MLELQQIPINQLPHIGYKHFMKVYKNAQPNRLIYQSMIQLQPSDNSLCFRKDLLERINKNYDDQ